MLNSIGAVEGCDSSDVFVHHFSFVLCCRALDEDVILESLQESQKVSRLLGQFVFWALTWDMDNEMCSYLLQFLTPHATL